jgi:hypothetical protein
VPGSAPAVAADPEVVADTLARILDDRAEAAHRSEAAARRVRDLYGLVPAAARLLSELDRLRDALAEEARSR